MENNMRASRRDGRQAWLIVVIMGLYFFVDLFQAALIGVGSIEAVLQQDFGLSNSDLAWLVGMFGWGNLLVIPFVGLALSRYSVRKITLVMLAICGFGALGTACASAHWMFFLFRAISGFSHAFCFLCATTLVTRWFSARRGGVAMGVFVGLGLCGPIIAHAFLAQLTNLLGSWRYALALFAVLPLLLFVLAFFVLQDDPDAVADVLLADRPTFKGFMQQVREVARQRTNLIYPCVIAFINAVISGVLFSPVAFNFFEGKFGGVWAARCCLLLSLGNMVGSLLWGWIASWWRSYHKPLLLGAVGCLLILLGLLFLLGMAGGVIWGWFGLPFFIFIRMKVYALVASGLCFALGFCSGSQVAVYPALAVTNRPALIGPAMMLNSFIVVLSMAVFPIMLGSCMGFLAEDVAVDYPWNYLKVFAPVLIFLVMAIVMLCCMQDPFPTSMEKSADKQATKPNPAT